MPIQSNWRTFENFRVKDCEIRIHANWNVDGSLKRLIGKITPFKKEK